MPTLHAHTVNAAEAADAAIAAAINSSDAAPASFRFSRPLACGCVPASHDVLTAAPPAGLSDGRQASSPSPSPSPGVDTFDLSSVKARMHSMGINLRHMGTC